ncbi:MAG: hypothetical protein HKN53_00425 [Maribacter sp.]|nr:hypothetical protein [Maribacter sp.]NND78341.1 hypothetical protein [Maribacter sp.]
MNTTRYILLIFSFILVIGACSNDDEGDSVDEIALASGNYALIELNINPPQDINNDGNTTSNVLTELPCVTGNLNLRSDGNWIWTLTETSVTSITGGAFFLSCTSDITTRSGSWTISGNQVTLYDGASNFNFTKDADQLTIIEGDDLPGFDSMVFER